MALPPGVVRFVVEEVANETHRAWLGDHPGKGFWRRARSAKSFVVNLGGVANHARGSPCEFCAARIRAWRTPGGRWDEGQHDNDREENESEHECPFQTHGATSLRPTDKRVVGPASFASAQAGFARRSLNCAGRASTQRGGSRGNRVSPVKRARKRDAVIAGRAALPARARFRSAAARRATSAGTSSSRRAASSPKAGSPSGSPSRR